MNNEEINLWIGLSLSDDSLMVKDKFEYNRMLPWHWDTGTIYNNDNWTKWAPESPDKGAKYVYINSVSDGWVAADNNYAFPLVCTKRKSFSDMSTKIIKRF